MVKTAWGETEYVGLQVPWTTQLSHLIFGWLKFHTAKELGRVTHITVIRQMLAIWQICHHLNVYLVIISPSLKYNQIWNFWLISFPKIYCFHLFASILFRPCKVAISQKYIFSPSVRDTFFYMYTFNKLWKVHTKWYLFTNFVFFSSIHDDFKKKDT